MRTIDEIFDDMESNIPWVTKPLMVAYKGICMDIHNRVLNDKELQNGNKIINGNNEATVQFN